MKKKKDQQKLSEDDLLKKLIEEQSELAKKTLEQAKVLSAQINQLASNTVEKKSLPDCNTCKHFHYCANACQYSGWCPRVSKNMKEPGKSFLQIFPIIGTEHQRKSVIVCMN